MTFSSEGPRRAELRLLLRSFTPGPELLCNSYGARAPWRKAAGRVAANSCSPAATPQELSREQILDLQHEAGAPQQRLDDDRTRCPGGLKCAQHPDSHPFTSFQASLVTTGFQRCCSPDRSSGRRHRPDRPTGRGAWPAGRCERPAGRGAAGRRVAGCSSVVLLGRGGASGAAAVPGPVLTCGCVGRFVWCVLSYHIIT